MIITKKQIVLTLGACTFSGLIGFLSAKGYRHEIATTLSIVAASTMGSAFITHTITDTRSQRKLNESKKLIESTTSNLDKSIASKNKLEVKLASLNDAIRRCHEKNGTLQIELTELDKTLDFVESDKAKTEQLVSELQATITQLEIQHKEHVEEVAVLTAETVAWEHKYNEELHGHVAHLLKVAKENEIQKIFDEHDELTKKLLSLFNRLQTWGHKVATGHQTKAEIIKSMAGNFNGSIDTANNAFNVERDNYLTQIEILQSRVGALQQKLAGDLTEPVYQDFKYDRNGEIANDIARMLFRTLRLTLSVKGVHAKSDGIVDIGYGYSRSAQPEAIVETIVRCSDDIVKELRIFKITSVRKLEVTDCIVISFLRECPKPPTDDEVYKEGLVPAAQFNDQIFIATDHRKQGKPTLRVMAATGDGKGIAVKNILSYFSELPDWEIWLSDPVDGSDEDHWHSPKIAKGEKEAGQAYKLFTELHRTRKNNLPAFTEKAILAVFDEFDKQHDEDDKDTAKAIMTAIRHTKQRQILIGQCAEVGANRWQWGDMGNCSLLALGSSIGILAKHLAKDLGWSIKRANEVKAKAEYFGNWARLKNEASNIPVENAYRVALLITGDRYSFLEIPSAHKGILHSGKGIFRDSLSITMSENIPLNDYTNSSKSLTKPTYPKFFKGEYTCSNPDCGCDSQTFVDVTPSKGTPRYKCDKCETKKVIGWFDKIN